jgi:hypothetical protein
MSDQPSQIPANKLVRVLAGNKLKYTVRIHRDDGSIIELQTDREVVCDYSQEFRQPVLMQMISDYKKSFVTLLRPTDIVLTEENP